MGDWRAFVQQLLQGGGRGRGGQMLAARMGGQWTPPQGFRSAYFGGGQPAGGGTAYAQPTAAPAAAPVMEQPFAPARAGTDGGWPGYLSKLLSGGV